MKREIFCLICREKFRSIEEMVKGNPEWMEGTKVVEGKANLDMICDCCGSKINFGSSCAAISMFSYGDTVYDWESEYINNKGAV